MEFVYNDIAVEKLIFSGTAQTGVEGELPLPRGRHASDTEVLWTDGIIVVNRVSVQNDETLVEGKVRLRLLCRDLADEGGGTAIFGFSASAPLNYVFRTPGTANGMRASARGTLLDIAVEQGARLTFSASANIECRVLTNAPLRVLDGVKDGGCEFLREDTVGSSVSEIGRQNSTISDSLHFKNAARVISAETGISVNDVKTGGADAAIEATAYVSMLAQTDAGELEQSAFKLPVSVKVPLDLRPEGAVGAALTVESTDIFPVDDNTLSAEINVSASVFDRTDIAISTVKDAYVPGRAVMPEIEKASVLFYGEPRQTVFRMTERLMLDESEVTPDKIVFTGASAVVTSSVCAEDGYHIQGVIRAGAVYSDAGGTISAKTFGIPFENFTAARCRDDDGCDARVTVLETVCTLVGNELIAEFSVELLLDPFSVRTVSYIGAMKEYEATQCRRALILCFAGGSESLFEIGKRLDVPVSELRIPDSDGEITEGMPVIAVGRAEN